MRETCCTVIYSPMLRRLVLEWLEPPSSDLASDEASNSELRCISDSYAESDIPSLSSTIAITNVSRIP